LQSRFERKKKFVAIRSELKEKRAEAGDTSMSASYHLASQYLTESSLTEDLNKYEFSVSGSAQVIDIEVFLLLHRSGVL
jgi:SOS response regulatory protein OraA/RecX